MNSLLSRDDFRETVFRRDRDICVFCFEPAVDAHHIIERRLWPDGGYYPDNGASVCGEHHLDCEMTILSVEDCRRAAGITKIIVPPHLYPDTIYDKWGNPILPSGQRLRGELFFDESVQKILSRGEVLDCFTTWVKYPRTWHVWWSPGVTKDDRVNTNVHTFVNQRVIVTEKMDGENTSMYCDHIHARSIDGRSHPSRDWVKQFWSQIAHNIPYGWRICGENLFAKHSIAYNDLTSYFQGFSIWNDRNECLSWDETLEWFELLQIAPVKVLYDDIFDEEKIKKLYLATDWERSEGYVIRKATKFPYGAFKICVAKYVRDNHVATSKHWMYGQPVEPNKISPS
ncbi:hypothetical protein LCGC14_2117480 [marine sediment metagenome]|uniref:RNA ligase domain-containing protein n=1 Tax=marine sediment metagenome TaxID=412755 RepID=A0A0F9E596_9ZZZZ